MKINKIIDNIFEDDNLQFICQADGEDLDKYKNSIKRKLNKYLTELLGKIVELERKYDLNFAEYIICKKCGTIAYGDGNCHCGKNKWKVWDFDLEEKIKELQDGEV